MTPLQHSLSAGLARLEPAHVLSFLVSKFAPFTIVGHFSVVGQQYHLLIIDVY